jgi:hypothetical protein
MKWRRTIAASATALVALAAVGALAWTVRTRSSRTPPRDEGRLLAVDDLRHEPERFEGEIRVFGVVGGTKASEQMLGLIDKREVEACGTTTCPEFLLPVRWRGPMPSVGDEVAVAGVLRKSPEGLVLEATGVDAP